MDGPVNHPSRSRLLLYALLLLALPSSLEAAIHCQKTSTDTLRELDDFVEERREIDQACKFNRVAPANNPNATLSGTCERTYKFMNGFVLQVRTLVGEACVRLESAQNADCRPGQAECLRSMAEHFDAAAAKLEKAEKLLRSAQKKMAEQRGLNADVGRVYGKNLEKIKETLEQQKGMLPPPKISALNQPSDISGADSAKTEGLNTLRDVIKAYDLPEDPKVIAARAQRIERAFGEKGQYETPELIGPFAGEQLKAYRRAGDFSRAAGTLGSDLHSTFLALQRNADQSRAAAAFTAAPSSSPARGFAGVPTGLALSRRSATGSLPVENPDEPIPTLDPDEPVVPLSAPGLRPEREYSLRDQLRRQLAAEEKARSNSTLATATDPDAAAGEQNMQYDRRLGGLTPLAAFTIDEEETATNLRELASAFQRDLEFPGEESPNLFLRVRSAHERFVRVERR